MDARVKHVGWFFAASLIAYGCTAAERRPSFNEADLDDAAPPPAPPPPVPQEPIAQPPVDASAPDPDAPVQGCAGTSVKAQLVALPADIVWVVDNSSSMSEEIDAVRAGINAFAEQLAASAVDYHLVMLSKRGTTASGKLYPVCVPEPLAGPDCGDSARFLHSDFPQEGIKSIQPLEQLLGSLGQTQGYKLGDSGGRGGSPWRQHLRAEASKSIVVVSDDNSRLSANAFLNTNGGLVSTVSGGSANCSVPPGLKQPHWEGLFDHLVVHAMVGPNGATYRELAEDTGGVVADISEAGGPSSPAWNAFFTTVAQEVVSAAAISCNLPMPAPPQGETLDPNRVNVAVASSTEPNGRHTLSRVTGADACENGGWYYDDPSAATEIRLCPASCAEMNAAPQETRGAEVVFGCATQVH